MSRSSPFKKEEILLPPSLLDRLPYGISVGYHLSDAILEEIENQPTPLYFHHYQRVNILLDTIGLIVTSTIQDLGYQAMPIPASQLVDWKNQRATFPINMWPGLRDWDGLAGTTSLSTSNLVRGFVWSPSSPISLLRSIRLH